jgi:hypothetical protein
VVSKVIRNKSHLRLWDASGSTGECEGGESKVNADDRRVKVRAISRWRNDRAARGYSDRSVVSGEAGEVGVDEEDVGGDDGNDPALSGMKPDDTGAVIVVVVVVAGIAVDEKETRHFRVRVQLFI